LTKLYYEAHVTIDPVFDIDRERAAIIAGYHKFKLANLIMRKREADEETPAQDDTFMTGHGKDLYDIKSRTKNLILTLQQFNFKVRRYKIEDTILDSRSEDVWKIL
jgi:hypothetical protein